MPGIAAVDALKIPHALLQAAEASVAQPGLG
jgi:hypothetical protein